MGRWHDFLFIIFFFFCCKFIIKYTLYIKIYFFKELSHVVSTLAPNQANNIYAWQSILKARPVISLGSRWRIGDGQTMKIRRDNWLPDQFSSKVISPHEKSLPNIAKVCTLINKEGHSWLEYRITTGGLFGSLKNEGK